MDDKKFQAEKSKILKNWKNYRFLVDLKETVEQKLASEEYSRYYEIKFEYNDQDVACQELQWPDVRDPL